MLFWECLKEQFKLFRKLRNGKELFLLYFRLPVCCSDDGFNDAFITSRNKSQWDHHRIINRLFVPNEHVAGLASVDDLKILDATLMPGYLKIAGDDRYAVIHENKPVFVT